MRSGQKTLFKTTEKAKRGDNKSKSYKHPSSAKKSAPPQASGGQQKEQRIEIPFSQFSEQGK